ncbi:MAG: hypothetical protein COW71_00210 [Ignavibacteriales bacterium CG18_big_fil_WC_8_21_14_2_50_31_20]|nr:MAG: hypothetical protein COW71_00210 [Ignavibacteriales bacterium CG18_big_fil_WC_8_21_14_2_50_31_20]
MNINTKFICNIFAIVLVFTAITFANDNLQSAQNSKKYTDECIKCHSENDMMPEHFSENDIHLQNGLSCAGCHGGLSTSADEEIAMSKKNGFVGVPTKKEIPNFCGKCHSDISKMQVFQARISTDQVSQYYISKHGMQLKIGNKDVATCIDCHTSHSILPASDTRSTVYAANIPNTCNNCHGNSDLMNKYNLKSNQVEEYSKGVHGIALLEKHDNSAPACNDCHGNHGAAPPGVKSISHICGSCHVNNMNFFNNSNMAEPFAGLEIKACEQCHGNHLIAKPSDEMLNVKTSTTCTECHDKGEDGYIASEMFYEKLTQLSELYDSTKAMSEKIAIIGMNNIEIEYELKNVKQALIQSRTLVHTFDTSKVVGRTNEGVLASLNALKLADHEIEEHDNRRIGYGISTLILILLAGALYLKIKGLNT